MEGEKSSVGGDGGGFIKRPPFIRSPCDDLAEKEEGMRNNNNEDEEGR